MMKSSFRLLHLIHKRQQLGTHGFAGRVGLLIHVGDVDAWQDFGQQVGRILRFELLELIKEADSDLTVVPLRSLRVADTESQPAFEQSAFDAFLNTGFQYLAISAVYSGPLPGSTL